MTDDERTEEPADEPASRSGAEPAGRDDGSNVGPADEPAGEPSPRSGGEGAGRSGRPSGDPAGERTEATEGSDGGDGPEAAEGTVASDPGDVPLPTPSAAGVGRRVLVVGGLAAVAAAAIGIARRRTVDGPLDADGGVAAPELDALRRVGEAYLRVRPEEASVDVLLAGLPAGATAPAGSGGAVALPEAPDVEAAVRADHAAGRVVEVDGWRFAETAGRLAALAHLTA